MENDRMIIKKTQIKIKDLIEGFSDTEDKGIWAFDGKLNIRPAYQREFKYSEEKQKAVIDTVLKNRPLNVMYWAKNTDENDNVTYEVIDGQQRTLSLIYFAEGEFTVPDQDGNLKSYTGIAGKEFKEIFDNYELDIYICEGQETEKLEWFRTINIAAAKMTEQELLNATYHGPFITELRKFFSPAGAAKRKYNADLFINGNSVDQDWLATALKWVSKGNGYSNVEDYLAKNRNKSAKGFVSEFANIIEWIKDTFMQNDADYSSHMKGLNWGEMYYKNKSAENYGAGDYSNFRTIITKYMKDSDVTKKSGIYLYCLDKQVKHLSIRAFLDNDITTKWNEQNHECANKKDCSSEPGHKFKINEMEADHITPWSLGGPTTIKNLQMLCKDCNRKKSGN